MAIRNYLKTERLHYTISLRDGRIKTIQLIEHIDGMNKNYKNVIGTVRSWRAEMIRAFLKKLITRYQEDLRSKPLSYQSVFAPEEEGLLKTNKISWNNEYKLTAELAMKLLFATKLISSMDRRPRIEEAFEIIQSLTDEEISFWAWKVLSLKNHALNGFKAMYLRG
jgi:hypothetical protein